jgi:transcriptional regulator with XRE-family HTH domain
MTNDLGNLLRLARSRAARSQRTVAAGAGIGQGQLSRYESGLMEPSWSVFRRVLADLGLQPRVLLEPLHADVDAAVRELRLRPRSAWLDDAYESVLAWKMLTAECDTTATGSFAARLLGAPTPLRVMTGDIVLDERGWEPVAAAARSLSALVEVPRTYRYELVVDGDHLREIAEAGDAPVHFNHRLRPSIALRHVPRAPDRRVRVEVADRWWWAQPLDLAACADEQVRLVVERAASWDVAESRMTSR